MMEYQASRIRIASLIIGIALALAFLFLREKEEDPWVKKARIESAERMTQLANTPNNLTNWPPVLDRPFPEIELFDHDGKKVSVESFKGKPTLVEIVTMTCAGCQAFSGGHKYGGFGGMPAQVDLGSIEEYYKKYTLGHDLFSDEINFVQIIIYNLSLNPASPTDVNSWRKHFKLDQHKNTSVLTGGNALATSASYYMIPGFLLLDKDTKVLFDATGHQPKHSLYTELLPGMNRILEQ